MDECMPTSSISILVSAAIRVIAESLLVRFEEFQPNQ